MDKEIKNASDNASKATLWYTVSNIMLRGISIITAPIFTRLLSTSDYGITSNFTSWAAIIMCISSLGLSTAVLRGKIEYDSEYKKFLSAVQSLGILWCAIIVAVMVIGINFWTSFMSLDVVCIFIMAIYLLTAPSLSYGQIDLRFDYKYKENVAIAISSTILNVGVAIGFIYLWSDRRYIGKIVGLVMPTVIFGLWFLIRIFRQGKCFFNKKYWKYALKLSLPMIPHGLAMIILGQIDRIMIIKYCGESEAGIYSFGYAYAVLLFVVTNAINDAIQPQMYEMLKRGKEEEMARKSYKLMMLGVALTVLIIGVGPEALRILGTKEYYDARWVIYPVALGTFMQYLYQFFGIVEIYSKKTIYMAMGSCGAAVVNYILNVVFIQRFGFIAAAYTTLATYGILMIFHFFMARIAYKKSVYKIIPLAIIVVVASVLGLGLNLVYDNLIIRYIALTAITVFMSFYLKDEISIILKKILKKG